MKTSGIKRIAQRYVNALFEVGVALSVLPQLEKDLKALGLALEENNEFRQFLVNPLLSRQAQAEAVTGLLQKMKAHEITQQFLSVLAQQRRLPILPEVIAQFVDTVTKSRGEIRAELISAAKLKVPEVAQISERLSKAYGKKVTLEVRQDPTILGGIIVKIGSLQFDGSLAGKMNRLKLALKAA